MRNISKPDMFVPLTWEKQASMLQNIVVYTDKVIFLHGEPGAGKTSFIKYFISQSKSVNSCYIKANSYQNTEQLLSQVADNFGVKDSRYLMNAVRNSQLGEKTWLIIIDECDELSAEQIVTLLNLKKPGLGLEFSLHLLFIGNDSFIPRLSDAVKFHLSEEQLHLLKYSNLNELDTCEFINYLAHDEHVCDYEKVFADTNGNISLIAKEVFKQKGVKTVNSNNSKYKYYAASVLTMVVFSWFFISFPNKPINNKSKEILIKKEDNLDPLPVMVYAPAKKHITKPVEVKIDEEATKPEVIAKKPEVIQKKPEVKKVVTSPVKAYGIQLYGAYDRREALRFIKSKKLSKKATIQIFKHKGKNWYTVIYGGYANKESAQVALRAMPKSIKSLDPWVRKLKR